MSKGSKSKACQREAEADATTLKTDLDEIRALHVPTQLFVGPEPEAIAHAEQPEDSVPNEPNRPPAEPSVGQSADSGADQEATKADATEADTSNSTSRASACVSGQLLVDLPS